MRKPTKLPPIELLELHFKYDPVLGHLIGPSGQVIGQQRRDHGGLKCKIGKKQYSLTRICWALFYREDPVGYHIRHIDKDPRNNCIDNLRAVKL